MSRRASIRIGSAAIAFLGVVCGVVAASAQTIGGAVQEHADRNLEKKKKQAPPPAHHSPPPPSSPNSSYRPHAPPPRPQRSARRPTATAAPQPAAPAEPAGPDLPQRVIGKYLKLDPEVGGAWRGWYAQQYPKVGVDNAGYLTWALALRLRLFKWISIERGYYESNALAPPRHSGASVVEQASGYVPKAAWLMGAIGFPIDWVIEPLIRYETRASQTTASVKGGAQVRIIPRSASKNQPATDFPLTSAPLEMVSGYESLVLAGKYNPSNAGMVGMPAGDFPPFYLGVGLVQYTKPYQFNVGDAVLDEYVFDARFRGAGLALGLSTSEEPYKFYVDFSGIVGLGEARLLDDLTLNEVIANDTLIGFVQSNVTVGYLYPLTTGKPTPMIGASLSGGGASFFFFKTVYQENEPVEAPPLNWDLLYGVQARFVVPL